MTGKIRPFAGKKQIVAKKQTVRDIMNEVYNAHTAFASDYDYLADYFEGGSVRDIANRLFNFCKKNIRYKVESDRLQTTRSPSGILYLRHGDCKHYAGFVAGVLDAYRRRTGKKFPLAYRFANYDLFDSEPQHVFVVIGSGKDEIWVDPVLDKFDTRKPFPINFTDKKIPMALVRLSGVQGRKVGAFDFSTIFSSISTPTGTGSSTSTTGTQYQQAANQLGKMADIAASQIPFLSLAQGLITQFFGKGGISDWLSPSGIINEIRAALFGRLYRGGQYWLGEKFRYYVLGEDIHTRDADVVTDEAVTTAMAVFSVGFGVPIDDYQDILNLQKGVDAYIARYQSLGVDPKLINRDAVARAVKLKQQYFPTEYEGNWKPIGPPPQKWDLNNMNKIPLVVPIPDFTKPYVDQWLYKYTGKIPDGEVRDGIVIAGQFSTMQPGSGVPGQPAGKFPTMLLLVGGGILAYVLLRKRR